MDPAQQKNLHPEAVEAVQRVTALNLPAYPDCESVAHARQVSQTKTRLFNEDPPSFSGNIYDLQVPHATCKDESTPVTVYCPHALSPNPTILVYFHGGGMVLGSRTSSDSTCRILAQQGEMVIVNVEYRLCPEHKFPAMMDDGEAVVTWVLDNKTTLGGSTGSMVGVAGDSAGGHISSSISHRVPGISFQVLVYPYVSDQHFKSYDEYANVPGLSMAMIEWFRKMWVDDKEELSKPRLSPLHSDRFDHLPPALLVVAECDPLRDHSYAYQDVLHKAGVHAELFLVRGVLHGYFTLPGVYTQNCKTSYDKICDFIKQLHI